MQARLVSRQCWQPASCIPACACLGSLCTCGYCPRRLGMGLTLTIDVRAVRPCMGMAAVQRPARLAALSQPTASGLCRHCAGASLTALTLHACLPTPAGLQASAGHARPHLCRVCPAVHSHACHGVRSVPPHGPAPALCHRVRRRRLDWLASCWVLGYWQSRVAATRSGPNAGLLPCPALHPPCQAVHRGLLPRRYRLQRGHLPGARRRDPQRGNDHGQHSGRAEAVWGQAARPAGPGVAAARSSCAGAATPATRSHPCPAPPPARCSWVRWWRHPC